MHKERGSHSIRMPPPLLLWWVTGGCVALFTWNVFAVVVQAPWWARPLGVAAMVADGVVDGWAWLGARLGNVYVYLAQVMTEWLERLRPALVESVADIWRVVSATWKSAVEFCRALLTTIEQAHYVRVAMAAAHGFIVSPLFLLVATVLAVAGIILFVILPRVCPHAPREEHLESEAEAEEPVVHQRSGRALVH